MLESMNKLRKHYVKQVTIGLLLAVAQLASTTWAQQPPTPSILNYASPNAQEISGLFWLVVGFSALVLLVVVVFMGAGIVQARRQAASGSEEEPPQIHGSLVLEVTWTLIPLAILGVLLVFTVRSLYALDGFAAPEDALHVNVTGQQFWWEMVYPEEGVVTANELVVPVGRPVRVNLSSKDVMHSFWVPQLAGKTDLVPGNSRALWFTAEREGIYHGQCAELCGDSHANMRFRVVALAPMEYEAWVQAAQQPSPAVSGQLASRGEQLFITKGCVGCHAVQDVNTYNRVGPNLSHVGSRTAIAAGILPNTRENMVRWLRYTDRVKPGVLMPNLGLSEDEAEAIAAYLEQRTLPGLDMRAIIEGRPYQSERLADEGAGR